MPTLKESVCCQSLGLSIQNQGEFNDPIHFHNFNDIYSGCITDNEFTDIFLNPVLLEVSLRNIWSISEEVVNTTVSNKNPTIFPKKHRFNECLFKSDKYS